MSCTKGHLFCKSCIIENLVIQKEEIKKNLEKWKDFKLKKEIEEKNKIKDELNKKRDALIMIQDGIEVVDSDINVENVNIYLSV